jgi:hypothetical protein
MALAGVVLLIACYVSAYVWTGVIYANGTITPATSDGLNRTIYGPIVWYVNARHPGGDHLRRWRRELMLQAAHRAAEAEIRRMHEASN